MNIQTKPPLTVAEQALMDVFSRRAGTLAGNGAVADLRDRLMGELRETGLPTRRIESWHYTDFRSLLKAVPQDEEPGAAAAQAPLVGGSTVLAAAGNDAPQAALPAGVRITPFAASLADGAALVALEPRGFDDAIGRINGGLVSGGLSLDVAPGVTFDAPIEIQTVHGGGHSHLRFPVTIGANVSATVVDRHVNSGGAAALTSAVTELTVGSDAALTWIIVQTEGGDDTHLGQINIRLEENARLTLHVVNAGGKLVRQEIHVVAAGEGADMQLRAVNLLGGDSHTDVTLTLAHDVPHTTSTEIVRNVVFDRAKGVFQGQIRVAPAAQKTDARMACNTLLLSDDGDFSIKPELEIFADDVQCAHGATVADIDDNHLFYLMSRGITERRARALLVKAFVNEIVDELDNDALVEALHHLIETWLEKHG